MSIQSQKKVRSENSVQFGFLDYPKEIDFGIGKIIPLDDFEEIRNNFKSSCIDGFYFPPSNKVETKPFTDEVIKKVPNSEKPAFLHNLPASHIIHTDNSTDHINLKKHDLGFIILLVSFLFGTRLQFSDWWVDRKIKINFFDKEQILYTVNNFSIKGPIIEEFVGLAYRTWKNWNKKEQEGFLGILTMHSRFYSYDWDWEQFSVEYMVFDGLYKLCFNKNNDPHKERINKMINTFNLKPNIDEVKKIYNLRNNLIHEAIWDETSVGYPKPESTSIYQTLNLKRINERLIFNILGYNNEFVKSPWWTIGNFNFDKIQIPFIGEKEAK